MLINEREFVAECQTTALRDGLIDIQSELDMLHSIALGMTVKQFREAHGIPDGAPVYTCLTEKQISDICKLQRMDTGLILGVRDFQERKRILTKYRADMLDKSSGVINPTFLHKYLQNASRIQRCKSTR